MSASAQLKERLNIKLYVDLPGFTVGWSNRFGGGGTISVVVGCVVVVVGCAVVVVACAVVVCCAVVVVDCAAVVVGWTVVVVDGTTIPPAESWNTLPSLAALLQNLAMAGLRALTWARDS